MSDLEFSKRFAAQVADALTYATVVITLAVASTAGIARPVTG